MATAKTPAQLQAEALQRQQIATTQITPAQQRPLPAGLSTTAAPAGLVGVPQTQVQTMQAPAGGLVGAPAPVAAPGMQPAQVQMREVNPIYREVQANETMQGQLQQILSDDNPLLQRARARAAAGMQSRGLSNSTMAIGASEGAMYDVAMPIAQQDASTYAQAGLANQQVGNQTQQFNATQFNEGSMFNAGETNKFGIMREQERGAMERLNVQESGQDRRQLVQEKGAMDRLNISEAGQTLRSREQNQTTLTATKMNNDTQRYSTDVNASVSRENARLAADTSRYTANLSAETQRAVSDAAINSQNSRAGADLWNQSQNRIALINANPDYDAATRERLVQNELRGVQQGVNLVNGARQINLAVGA